MQQLQVKVRNKDGSSGLKTVTIVRAWTETGGKQLFLHQNGTYGYKDGSPVMGVKDFDLIGDAHQKAAALDWWDRKGEKLSNEFYERKAEEDAHRQEQEKPVIEGDFSDLDVIQYIRRPIEKRTRAAYSDPCTWLEWFDGRPDWWGFARVIEIRGYRYEVVDPGREPADTNAPLDTAKQLDVIEEHLTKANKEVALTQLQDLRKIMDEETILELITNAVKEGIGPLSEKLAEMSENAQKA